MTVSTTYFRENLAEIISLVVDKDEEVILVFGKGKNAKRTKIVPIIKKTKKKNSTLTFLRSSKFKNHQVNPKFQKSKDFKKFMLENYNVHDFLV